MSNQNRLVSNEEEVAKSKTALAVVENEKTSPLSADDFKQALEKVDSIGLTWTADRIPAIRPKDSVSVDVLSSRDLELLQREYPHLPVELSAVMHYSLTGTKPSESLVGNVSELEKKAKVVRELVVTPAFRAEFFFKQAMKIPYLENIDWEIVFKVAERGVNGIPGVSYALLSLVFHDPNISGKDKHETVTVAVNKFLVNKLLDVLGELKEKLDESDQITDLLNEKFDNRVLAKGKEDAISN